MRHTQVYEETLTHTRITIGPRHYYFRHSVSLEDIADATATKRTFEELADVVYNYKTGRFEKCRWESIEYLNGT